MRAMQTTTNTQPTSSNSTAEATIDRYLVMWNESDDSIRSDQAHAVWAEQGRLVDPLIEAVGPEQIAAAIGDLQDQLPGHSLSRTTVVDAHHGHARFGWTVNGPDGTVAVAGIDVVTFGSDGRIETAIGFFGDPAPAA
jgi:hypothetical protein